MKNSSTPKIIHDDDYYYCYCLLACRYCDPSHAFPSQREAIEFAVSTALKALEREPRTLVVCGAYTIGKERIFMGNDDDVWRSQSLLL